MLSPLLPKIGSISFVYCQKPFPKICCFYISLYLIFYIFWERFYSDCLFQPCTLIELFMVIYRRGDITQLNTEAIVNPTNESINDKNPVSEKIFAKAGPDLKKEIRNNLKGKKQLNRQ